MTHRESVQSNVIVSHAQVKLECELGYTSILTHLHINLPGYKADFTRNEYNRIIFYHAAHNRCFLRSRKKCRDLV